MFLQKDLTEAELSIDMAKEDEARAAIAEMILLKGADGNATESKGRHTPLHLCAMNGYARVARVLLGEHGRVDVNPVNILRFGCIQMQ